MSLCFAPWKYDAMAPTCYCTSSDMTRWQAGWSTSEFAKVLITSFITDGVPGLTHSKHDKVIHHNNVTLEATVSAPLSFEPNPREDFYNTDSYGQIVSSPLQIIFGRHLHRNLLRNGVANGDSASSSRLR